MVTFIINLWNELIKQIGKNEKTGKVRFSSRLKFLNGLEIVADSTNLTMLGGKARSAEK